MTPEQLRQAIERATARLPVYINEDDTIGSAVLSGINSFAGLVDEELKDLEREMNE